MSDDVRPDGARDDEGGPAPEEAQERTDRKSVV